ncbi:MAG: PAS domain-containing protein [Alphaproteobacteria bacterium]|nr:PAS domain-containing protein [Alphaproteobacteria bacterium]
MIGRSWVWVALASLFFLSAAAIVDRAEEARFAEAERLAVFEAASGKRALLEAHLNARLHIISGLTALVHGQPDLRPDQFSTYAAGLVSGISGVRAVQLASGAVISHVWPLAGNSQSVGHDLLADPERRDATQRTISGRRLVLAGPFPLRQGGEGLVARQPIFLTKGGQESFWGLAIVVLDLQQLLFNAGLNDPGSIRIALRGKDGRGGEGEPFFGDPKLFRADAVLMDVTFPHGTWQLAAEPEGGWSVARPGRWRFVAIAILMAGLVAVAGIHLARNLERRRQAEEAMERNLAASNTVARILSLSLLPQPLEQVLEQALQEILGLSWLRLEQRGSIFLTNRSQGHLVLAAQHSLPDEVCLSCRSIPIGHCLCGRAAAEATTVFAAHIDARHAKLSPNLSDHGHYCVPICGGEGVLGVLNTYIAPGQDRQDDRERFLAVAADTLAGIIERCRVQRAFGESEQRTRALMNASADASFLIDRDGAILACNAALADAYGSRPEELVDHTYFSLLPEAQALYLQRQFSIAFDFAQPVHLFDERDGRTFEVRVYPISNETGTVVQAAVFSRDITEQKNAARAIETAAAELARSNEDLQQFAYATSHDLRQPLRMVSSYLALIERKLGSELGEDTKTYLGYAVNGAKRMDRLIVDLLDYSRVGRSGEAMAEVPLQEVVAEALENLGPAIADVGAEVEIDGPLPVVVGGRLELLRLFQNLIGNAVKYRSEARKSQVAIKASRDADGWLISVRDNGMGIPAEAHSRVFGVFQRLAGSEGHDGTGIGLAICKKIVEHHGGRIWVESEPDFGANFLFTLPVAYPRP